MNDVSTNFRRDFRESVSNACAELNLKVVDRDPNRIDVFDTDQTDFYLRLEKSISGPIVAFFVIRTSSWMYDGERTDLHDIESLLFSFICLGYGKSSSLWDVANVFTGIDDELYARYVSIVQPNLSVLTDDELGSDNVCSLLNLYKEFQNLIINLTNHASPIRGYSWDVICVHSLSNRIAKALGLTNHQVTGCSRKNPDWFYFQAYKAGITVFWSKRIEAALLSELNDIGDHNESMEDNETHFIKGQNARNSFSEKDISSLRSVLIEVSDQPITFYALESHVVAASGGWVVARKGNFGVDRYISERTTFINSLHPKINFLFESARLIWNTKADPGRFEALCRELLSRERNVIRTRLVSPTNQPDRGRDIIMDYASFKPINSVVMSDDQPLHIARLFVQCKLTSKTLGIPSGIGPVESLYLGDYEGYFLITNSILSSDHTALLEKLRSDGRYLIEWWTNVEVEERLRSNFDILHNYSDVVKY